MHYLSFDLFFLPGFYRHIVANARSISARAGRRHAPAFAGGGARGHELDVAAALFTCLAKSCLWFARPEKDDTLNVQSASGTPVAKGLVTYKLG